METLNRRGGAALIEFEFHCPTSDTRRGRRSEESVEMAEGGQDGARQGSGKNVTKGMRRLLDAARRVPNGIHLGRNRADAVNRTVDVAYLKKSMG